MAYYDALIAKWPSVTGADTATKLANLNAMTVTGSVPTVFSVSGAQIYNCLVPSEWLALTAAQQQNVRDIFGLGDNIPAGTGTTVQTVLLSIFAAGSGTRANLVALAQATSQPWWQANGYPGIFNNNDLIAAGNLT